MTSQVSVKLLNTMGESLEGVLEYNSLSDAPFMTTLTPRQVFKRNLDSSIASPVVSVATHYKLLQDRKE